MAAPLIEFPADDPERALAFWKGVLGVELAERDPDDGAGWEADLGGARSACTSAGRGPATPPRFRTSPWTTWRPRWSASSSTAAKIIHPGERWAICRDSEGSPFALSA